jgi:serine/threonine-protein kinase
MAMLGPSEVIADRYEITDFIGEGGMQEVYLARDLTFDQFVALKAPKNEAASKRFSRSARVSAQVTHPNVAKTLDYIPGEERDYLVEEFVPGRDLKQRLDAEFEVLDPHLAAHLVHHIARAIAASHHAGVLHRDLKPSNIMVSDDPGLLVVKVTDFGIAKMAEDEIEQAVSGEDEESLTGSQTAMGAVPYMAPENFNRDLGHVLLPSDIWSIGALLYHFLVGERPFGAGWQAIPKIVAGTLPERTAVMKVKPQFKHITQALWDVATRCMSLKPEDRPTADALVSALAEIPYSTATRRVGRIYNFGIPFRTCGFIESSSGDCFFHEDSFYGTKPVNGMTVNFAPFSGSPRDRAFPILPLRDS